MIPLESIRYVGSGEHKRFPNPLCDPALHSDKSNCDDVDPALSQDPARLERLLRTALERQQHDTIFEGSFPRFVWGALRVAGNSRLFEARLTNRLQGHYKGYFIGPEDLVGKKAWVRKHLLADGDWSAPLE